MKKKPLMAVSHKDPYRYPKIQKKYEDKEKAVFQPIRMFGDMVQEMTNIIKERKV